MSRASVTESSHADRSHGLLPISAQQRSQRLLHVCTDRDLRLAIPAELLRVNVDLREGRAWREQSRPAERNPKIDALSKYENEIGLRKYLTHRDVQRGMSDAHSERMRVAYRASRHAKRVDRY